MGLIVLLIGLIALSSLGLIGFGGENNAAVTTTAGPSDGAPTPITPAPTVAASPAIAAGDALFKSNCAQCHAVHDKVVGPALAGITKRRSISWLMPWVKNSSKVIASGDEYAVKLFNDNGKQQMPAFPQLSDENIQNIMAWVTAQEGPTTTGAVATN
ncbi:c-type cytochrome [Hymenobacter sp. UV11]|nr:c-type cytochrome [Hymenobacter sp. UV11]